MSVFLKIKIKSLAAEAKIIRAEESKSYYRDALMGHRKGIVRQVARDTLIAYGFLRGKKYKEIEPNAKTKPNWKAIDKMVQKYWMGGRNWTESKYKSTDLDSWKDGLI